MIINLTIYLNNSQVEGKFQKAESYGLDTGDQEEIIPTDEEKDIVDKVRGVWAAILKSDVADDTDFFGAGAGSMDVVRLIEEVRIFVLNSQLTKGTDLDRIVINIGLTS